jgi:hypothetical protein
MRRHRASFKHMGVLAIALTAFGSLFVTGAKAQTTTWTIQLDVTGSGSKPAYSLVAPIPKPAKERCDFTDQTVISTAENLQVCPDDTINWVAKSNGAHIEVFLYHKDAVLFDDEGDPAHGFHATNKDTAGGIVSGDVTSDVYYKYYVVVFDKDRSGTYYDDPKIMIGTGNRQMALAKAIEKKAKQLEAKAEELRKLIDSQRIRK